jgi:Tfp pilus assembly protein PilV
MYRSPAARSRRGAALIDVVIAGVLLGIGLAVLISLVSRSLMMQTQGEKRMTASWLADELLAMVVVEGPDEYAVVYDLSGRFFAPFEEFVYDVAIDQPSIGSAYEVSATIRWGAAEYESVRVDTLVADREQREEDPELVREPYEPLDRDARNFDEDDQG